MTIKHKTFAEKVAEVVRAPELSQEQLAAIILQVTNAISIPDVTGKVDKETGKALLATTEAAKIHSPGSDDQVIPTSLPASDVYTWAKAAVKPSYNAGEVGAEPAKGTDDNFVTDAEKAVISNTSGTNSGDNAVNSNYSGLASSKQDALVSTTNIKSINGSSVLGSGDLTVSGGLNQQQILRLC